jgi:hypothetical protein
LTRNTPRQNIEEQNYYSKLETSIKNELPHYSTSNYNSENPQIENKLNINKINIQNKNQSTPYTPKKNTSFLNSNRNSLAPSNKMELIM